MDVPKKLINMDDFYKKIKDNIKNRQEPKFREGAWTALEKRMQQENRLEQPNNKSGSTKRVLPFFAFLLLGSVLLNGWFVVQYQSAQNLNTRKHTIQIDTIIKTNLIYQRDTIYLSGNATNTQTFKPSSKLDRQVNSNNRSSYSKDFKLFSNFDTNFLQPDFFESIGKYQHQGSASTFHGNYSSLLIDFPINKIGLQNRKDNNNIATDRIQNAVVLSKYLETIPIKYLTYEVNTNISNQLEVVQPFAKEVRKKGLRYRMNQIRPKSINIGFNAGVIFSEPKTFELRKGFTSNIKADLVFSKNLRMFSEFGYLNSHYSRDEMGDDIGIPLTTSPNDDFDFVEAKVELPAFQYVVGLQYFFNTNRKIQPYLGLGFSGLSTLPYEVQYEFKNRADGLELLVDKEISQKYTINNQFIFEVGLEYPIKDNWSVQLNSFYRYGKKSTAFSPSNIFGLKSGLLYHF